jgi:hypothetical protein
MRIVGRSAETGDVVVEKRTVIPPSPASAFVVLLNLRLSAASVVEVVVALVAGGVLVAIVLLAGLENCALNCAINPPKGVVVLAVAPTDIRLKRAGSESTQTLIIINVNATATKKA